LLQPHAGWFILVYSLDAPAKCRMIIFLFVTPVIYGMVSFFVCLLPPKAGWFFYFMVWKDFYKG